MLIGFVLAMIGFSQEYPTQDTLGTSQLRLVTIILFIGVPVCMLSIALFFMKFYTLDKQKMIDIQEKIQQMKSSSGEDENEKSPLEISTTNLNEISDV